MTYFLIGLCCCDNIFVSGFLLSCIYFLNIYFKFHDIFFELPNASRHISWMPCCVVATYLWMTFSALYIFLNAYCVFCAYLWIPVVALYISMSTCCCLVHFDKWPIYKKETQNHIFFIYLSSQFLPSQPIQVFLTQDELVIIVKPFYPSKGTHNSCNLERPVHYLVLVDML